MVDGFQYPNGKLVAEVKKRQKLEAKVKKMEAAMKKNGKKVSDEKVPKSDKKDK